MPGFTAGSGKRASAERDGRSAGFSGEGQPDAGTGPLVVCSDWRRFRLAQSRSGVEFFYSALQTQATQDVCATIKCLFKKGFIFFISGLARNLQRSGQRRLVPLRNSTQPRS